MSKQITPNELAEIVSCLLTKTISTGELDNDEKFQSFMTEIAGVVCDHCGGEVRNPAAPLEEIWYIGIHGNDSLPDGSEGIWQDYDKEGTLFDKAECSRCGSQVNSIIGTPGGEELCTDCFSADENSATISHSSQQEISLSGFVEMVASLRIWSYDSDLKTNAELGNLDKDGDEINEPDDGFIGSHTCLMDLIEQARGMQHHGASDPQADLEKLMTAIVQSGQKAGIIRPDLESISMTQCLFILQDLSGASILGNTP